MKDYYQAEHCFCSRARFYGFLDKEVTKAITLSFKMYNRIVTAISLLMKRKFTKALCMLAEIDVLKKLHHSNKNLNSAFNDPFLEENLSKYKAYCYICKGKYQ